MQPEQIILERYKAEQTYKSAASWFWWIGALSILNSAIAMSGKQFNFTFGLGVSQIGDAWMASDSGLLSTVGLFLSFGFAGLFLLLAWLAQHTRVALPIGIAVYAVDAVLFLAAQGAGRIRACQKPSKSRFLMSSPLESSRRRPRAVSPSNSSSKSA